MKYLFSILFSLVVCSSFAQVDSLGSGDIYKVDTVIVSDTTYVVDTVIVQDTLIVKRAVEHDLDRDTIFLSSHQESWSVIPQDEIEDQEEVFVRQDSGLFLISAKISFSDNYDDNDWDGYSISNLPPISVQVDYFHNNFLSYGAQLLYGRDKYTNDTLSTSYVKNGVTGLAAIGSFHYGSWLQDVTHNKIKFRYLDLYASLAFRFDVHHNVKSDYWNDATELVENENKTVVKMKVRPILGARYYISDHFSINVEFGKGNLGMLSSSVSWVL